MYENLEKLCEVAPNELFYHYFSFGLCINIKVQEVHLFDDYIEFIWEGISVKQWRDSKILQCRRPDNLLIQCQECYRIYNEYGEPIGYIYRA